MAFVKQGHSAIRPVIVVVHKIRQGPRLKLCFRVSQYHT